MTAHGELARCGGGPGFCAGDSLSALASAPCILVRFAEELVIWSSAQFRFVQAVDRFTDRIVHHAAEEEPRCGRADRAKIGRILGATVALMTGDEGSAADLFQGHAGRQRARSFDAADALLLALAAMDGMVGDHGANRGRSAEAAGAGIRTATDLADWWCGRWICRSRGASCDGALVAMAEKKGCDLPDLTLADMQGVHADITDASVRRAERRELDRIAHVLWWHGPGAGWRTDRRLARAIGDFRLSLWPAFGQSLPTHGGT